MWITKFRLARVRQATEEFALGLALMLSASVLTSVLTGRPNHVLQAAVAIAIVVLIAVRIAVPFLIDWNDRRLDRLVAARNAAWQAARTDAEQPQD